MLDAIHTVKKAVGHAHWNLNFEEFCKIIEREESDQWAKDFWLDFQNLNTALGRFDAQTLAKIITP
ncbi:MAG: hypothetical protein KY445_16335 [Armatimonadetes bacterium]|nr:hypothetical protein [Armatimonadota bacterium]